MYDRNLSHLCKKRSAILEIIKDIEFRIEFFSRSIDVYLQKYLYSPKYFSFYKDMFERGRYIIKEYKYLLEEYKRILFIVNGMLREIF